MNVFEEAKRVEERLVSVRRKVHEMAEVGFELTNTMAFIETELKAMGLFPQRCGGGIFADIEGQSAEKILLRADCDALPAEEKSSLPFAAQNGNAHLCGHDMHTAMLLCAAEIITGHRRNLKRGVRLVFQPAEEILSGAKSMIEGGVLTKDIRAAYGLHVIPSLPLKCGTVILPPAGAVAPYAEFFRITVQGKGSHGAAPHRGRDALLCSAGILCALQTPIAREADPAKTACLTVGMLNGGNAPNAICHSAAMEGTLRAFEGEVAELLSKRAEEIACYTALSYGCTAKFEKTSSCPALVNDAALLEAAKGTLSAALPEGYFTDASAPGGGKSIGGSEDFAYFSQELPSLFFSLAAGDPDKYPSPLHHPEVRFDEAALPYGCAALAALALSE